MVMTPSPGRKLRPSQGDAGTAAAAALDSLPRLPIRDAVLTSSLSRAWRRRWESVPYLTFCWPRRTPPGAISAALRRYSGPVRKFSNLYIGDDDFRHSDRWLLLLAGKGVQSLFLAFRRSDEEIPTLHSSIFSCCELTQLELADCCIPGLPTCFAGFPNLTSLRLSDVGFPDGAKGLEILLARSPLLKSLSLLMLLFPAKNGVHHQWVIQAPNLQNFFITGLYDDGWQIGDLPFLEEATVDWPLYSYDRDFVKLITGLSQARDLDFAMPVRDVNVLEGLSCSFKNLKCLSLCTSLHLLSNVLSLFCIIRNASKLEALRI